jgi:cysteine desulfuration protein SufE
LTPTPGMRLAKVKSCRFPLAGKHLTSSLLQGVSLPVPDLQSATKLDEILENFEYLDEWEDRYRYLIELGRGLERLDAAAYNDSNKVRGCVSQVWLETRVVRESSGSPVLYLKGDSDAHIVRGLVALLLALYSGQTASRILAIDARALFERLGLSTHLTPQRSNGVRSMIERIRADARAAAAA